MMKALVVTLVSFFSCSFVLARKSLIKFGEIPMDDLTMTVIPMIHLQASTLQVNRNTFLQDEYTNLKEFYNQVIAKNQNKL